MMFDLPWPRLLIPWLHDEQPVPEDWWDAGKYGLVRVHWWAQKAGPMEWDDYVREKSLEEIGLVDPEHDPVLFYCWWEAYQGSPLLLRWWMQADPEWRRRHEETRRWMAERRARALAPDEEEETGKPKSGNQSFFGKADSGAMFLLLGLVVVGVLCLAGVFRGD